MNNTKTKFEIKDLDLYYGDFQALKKVGIDIYEREITALIGPSGCGKSTFLRTLNRMNDLIPGTRIEGQVKFDNKDIYDKDTDVIGLRKKVGMVFQKPNPFPKSIYDNITFGPRMGLSGGQQQRLCIARCLAVEPEVLLMDEPTSALDPVATSRIEALLQDLAKKYTIVIVTHNMQQAGRVSGYTSFFLTGEIIETGLTEKIFSVPENKKTEEYISGRFG